MKFIKVCELSLGSNFTCIYHFLNVDSIVSIFIEVDKEKYLGDDKYHSFLRPIVTTSNGNRFLIVYRSDLVDLVGEKVVCSYEEDL